MHSTQEARILLGRCLAHLQAYSDQSEITKELGQEIAEFLGEPFVPSAEPVQVSNKAAHDRSCICPLCSALQRMHIVSDPKNINVKSFRVPPPIEEAMVERVERIVKERD